MKKKFILFVLLLFISPIFVFAAPVTYTRTARDLRVPDDVSLESNNTQTILKIPSVDEKAKIYDFADLLTDAEETSIYIELNEFINHTGLDAIIITTSDLAGFAMNEYTYHFYDYNYFKNNGLAFLIYQEGDSIKIFMANNGPEGSAIFAVYTEDRSKEILKYVYDKNIRKGDYAGACRDYVEFIEGFYEKTLGTARINDKGEIETEKLSLLAVALISFVLTFIVVALTLTKLKKPVRRVDQTIKKSLENDSMIVKCEYDKPISGKS